MASKPGRDGGGGGGWGGGLRILCDRDDQIGTKIKTQKNA